jgi:protein-arginine deiminase
MLAEQEIQDPIELDVGFLCVGHVDEFVTFLPDPSAPQGFRLYVTDTEKGYEFFSSLDASHSLPLYQQEYGYENVGDILADSELRELNEEIQETYIEPNIIRFKNDFGLSDDEIVRVPMLFEAPQGCFGATATLLPGVVNMAVFTHEDQKSADAFIPDPFFRSDLNDYDSDPYIAMFSALLPEGVTPHWVNDWEWYHVQLGEVHCGSNIKRTAIQNWWEE